MRPLVLPALLGLLVALPASAQSQFADSAGTYVSVDGFPVAYGGAGLGLRLGTSVEVGRRFGNGFDLGALGSFGTYGEGRRAWSAGVVAGLTRPAPLGTVARLQASAVYHDTGFTYGAGERVGSTSLVGDVSATAGTSVRLFGSFRVRPAVGVYARASRDLSLTVPARLGAVPLDLRAEAGVQVELPLTFRLLGADAAFVPVLRFSPGTDGLRPRSGVAGTGFRLNF